MPESKTNNLPIFSSYIHWKHKKVSDFLLFSGGTEMEQWPGMG